MDDPTTNRPMDDRGGGDTSSASMEPAAPPPAAPPPAAPPPAAAPVPGGEAVKARWDRMGPNQRLVIVGGVMVLAAWLVGIILSDWSVGLHGALLLIATVVALAMVLTGSGGIPGLSRTAILRVSAATGGAYAAIDLGDLISGIDSWGPLDLIATAVADAGGLIIVIGAWRLTSGDFIKDAMATLASRGRALPARLVALGSAGLILAWVLIRIGDGRFPGDAAVAVLAAVLALTVLWLMGSGAGEIRLPLAANLELAALGVIAAVLAVFYFTRVVDELGEIGVIALIGIVLYLAGAAAMAAGGLLGLQGSRTGGTAPGSTGDAA